MYRLSAKQEAALLKSTSKANWFTAGETAEPTDSTDSTYLSTISYAKTNEQTTRPSTAIGPMNRSFEQTNTPQLVPTIPCKLPDYRPSTNSTFAWESVDSISFISQLDKIYKEAVHWRNNLFKIPQGNAGKSLTTELSRLFNAFATGSALEPIALKAATVLPHLILKKPFRNSKIQDHINVWRNA